MIDAHKAIKVAYNGALNWVTPNVLEIGNVGDNIAYEISYGECMGSTIYGVSVVSYTVEHGYNRELDLSKVCFSRDEAVEYITELQAANE